MKTAILLPGHPKFYRECVDNFREFVLKPFLSIGQVDIFMSIWSNIDKNHFGSIQHKLIINTDKLYEINYNEIVDLYKPRILQIIDFSGVKNSLQLKNFCDLNNVQNEIWNQKEWHGGILNTTCQFFQIYKTNELKKQFEQQNNFIYDFILKYRSDALAPDYIPVNKLIKDKLYLVDFGYNSKMVNDTIYLGNSTIIDYINDLYTKFNYFYSNAIELKHNFAIEKILFQHIEHLLPKTIRLAEFGLMNKKWKWYGRSGLN